MVFLGGFFFSLCSIFPFHPKKVIFAQLCGQDWRLPTAIFAWFFGVSIAFKTWSVQQKLMKNSETSTSALWHRFQAACTWYQFFFDIGLCRAFSRSLGHWMTLTGYGFWFEAGIMKNKKRWVLRKDWKRSSWQNILKLGQSDLQITAYDKLKSWRVCMMGFRRTGWWSCLSPKSPNC